MKLSSIFSKGAVLQRNIPIPVWGEGNGTVTVTVGDYTVTTKPKEGEWSVYLPPMSAGGPYTITVSEDGETAVFEDVYVGDVYLAGGQSNMELPLYLTDNHVTELTIEEKKDGCLARIFTVIKPWKDSHRPGFDEIWLDCSEKCAEASSAICMMFALEIARKEKVPVGIISCNLGGSVIQAWLTERAITESGAVIPPKKLLNPDIIDFEFNPVGNLHNVMTKKIVPYGIRAVLWYHGESNSCETECHVYSRLFSALERFWRRLFLSPELPFYTVGLAPFDIEEAERPKYAFHYLREQQLMAMMNDPNTELITIGKQEEDIYQIHPRDKKSIAHELALVATKNIYGEDIMAGCPYCEKMKAEDGKTYLYFDNSGTLYGKATFKVYFEDGYEKISDFVINKNVVVISHPGKTARRVDLAFTSYDGVYLYGEGDRAVFPFRITPEGMFSLAGTID